MEQGLRVSIVTVCLNSGLTISDCLQSIQNQTYKNIESIIVDGGSTDNTLDTVKKFPDLLIKILTEDGLGIYDAMNKGIQIATGDVIGILNSDDLLSNEDVIGMLAETFINHPEIEIVYGDLVYVDVQNTNLVTRYWRSGIATQDKFRKGWMPPHPTFYMRRSAFTKSGFYRNDMGSAGDYEFMLRSMIKHKLKFKYIPKVFVKMRRGGISNGSFFRRIKANFKDKEAWSVNNIKPHLFFSFLKPLRKLHQYFLRSYKD